MAKFAVLYAVLDLVNGQAALGGGAAGGGGATGSVVTTTTYKNGPTVAAPPIENGPWTDLDHLEGTWSSKSMMVMTGPDFYDPVDELLIEPALPGISFSFTKDGFFEQALYQVTADPTNTSCSTGALTFQHGTYNVTDDGKLQLFPFADDGRQLVSEPCNSNYSTYVQYDEDMVFRRFSMTVDLYYGRYRLDLDQFDGTPMPPMYLVYRPAQMLPTSTMNPGVKAQIASVQHNAKREVTAGLRERVKRSLVNRARTTARKEQHRSPLYNTVWWSGVGMIVFGATFWVYLS